MTRFRDLMEEALAIAQECPGLDYGSIVEVRPVADVCSVLQGTRFWRKAPPCRDNFPASQQALGKCPQAADSFVVLVTASNPNKRINNEEQRNRKSVPAALPG